MIKYHRIHAPQRPKVPRQKTTDSPEPVSMETKGPDHSDSYTQLLTDCCNAVVVVEQPNNLVFTWKSRLWVSHSEVRANWNRTMFTSLSQTHKTFFFLRGWRDRWTPPWALQSGEDLLLLLLLLASLFFCQIYHPGGAQARHQRPSPPSDGDQRRLLEVRGHQVQEERGLPGRHWVCEPPGRNCSF